MAGRTVVGVAATGKLPPIGAKQHSPGGEYIKYFVESDKPADRLKEALKRYSSRYRFEPSRAPASF